MVISVKQNDINYNIILENNLLDNLDNYLKLDDKAVIITDSLVPKVYLKKVMKKLNTKYSFVFNSGEVNKNLDTVSKIYNYLLENEFDRKSYVIALGGGIVGDLAGYVAATYKRGINFINIPTSSLAMIDSCVGSKVGVNFNSYKNVVGAFKNPKMVLIDPSVLITLPKRHLYNGLVEALKMGLCLNEELYKLFFEEEFNIEKIIELSIKTKKYIVETDPFEEGLRKVLNFGHTIGHAVESMEMENLLHGECVAIGMDLMIKDENLKKEVRTIFDKLDINYRFNYDLNDIVKYLKNDKKNDHDLINIIELKHLEDFEIKKVTIEDLINILRKGN